MERRPARRAKTFLSTPLGLALLFFGADADEPDPFRNLEFTLTRHTRDRYAADLEGIRRRGVLRVLTRNNSSAYFVARGRERGFEFELARSLARRLGVRVAFVVPDQRSDLIGMLHAGLGDMVAAGMTRTAARAEQVRFSAPLLEADRVVATHPRLVKRVESPADLAQLKIHTSFRSTTFRTAVRFGQTHGVQLDLADLPSGIEMEEQLRMVEEGVYEAVIVDSNILDLAQAAGVEAEAVWSMGPPLPKSWAFHPDAAELQAEADAFIAASRRNGLLNIMYARYYRPNALGFRSAQDVAFRADADGAISPFDDLFRRAGELVDIDWRLLAAIAYTESRFDPTVRSAWGAMGLMQVLPSTARRVGVRDPSTPWGSVRAGALYLRRLLDFFAEEGLPLRQQIRFALASYNAGLGHIIDARKLAPLIDRDPDRWFNHVEDALELKRHRKWHERSTYGYARAGETIAYVSRVQAQYDVFVRHVPLKGDEGLADEEEDEAGP